MKPSTLFAIALVLLALGAALWFWPVGAERLAVSVKPRVESSPLPAVAAVPPTTLGLNPHPQAGTPSPTPTPPIRYTSAVMPGQPVARSTPSPGAHPPSSRSAPAASQPPAAEPEGQRELEDVRSMFTNYHTRLGENPVGNNAEIMKAVMGENRQRVTLGPPHGQSLNQDGELIDRWGRPYFFHQLSKDQMEVRSSGPDGQMWTSDDLVTR